jgi:hypothetical protein
MGVAVMEFGNTSGVITPGVSGCSAYQTVRARSFVITAALIADVVNCFEPPGTSMMTIKYVHLGTCSKPFAPPPGSSPSHEGDGIRAFQVVEHLTGLHQHAHRYDRGPALRMPYEIFAVR